MHPSDWLTTTEVAELLRVHPKHVYRLLQAGMPARRVGGQWRFSRDEIQRWAKERSESGSPHAETSRPAPTPIVALEPNEISLAVARALGTLCPGKVAAAHTSRDIARDLLEEGNVAAALLPDLPSVRVPFTTLRIHLATRRVGLVARSRDALRTPPATVALPPCAEPTDAVARWLDEARAHGSAFVETESELEACSHLLNKRVNVALASQGWAERLALRFRQLDTERWELVLRAGALEDPCASGLCMAAQDSEMRKALRHALQDDDEVGRMRLVPGCGTLERTRQADGSLNRARRRRSRRSGSPRWTLLRHQRADQMLHFVKALRRGGLRVGGFLQLPAGPANDKPLGYDLYRIAQPERIPFAERIDPDRLRPPGQRFCDLAIRPASLDHAWQWLREDVGACDLLVIDGVGALEHGGKGFFPALAWARTLPDAKMIVVSSRREPNQGLTQRLALEPDRVTTVALDPRPDGPDLAAGVVLQSCGRRP